MSPPCTVLLGPANSIHLQRWARALHQRGRAVVVISQHAPPPEAWPAEIDLHLLPVRSALGYGLNVPFLRRLLKRLQPALVNAHYASGYGTLARLARCRPLLLSVWGSDVYEFPHRGRLQHALLCRNLRAAHTVASTSQAMAREVRRLVPGLARLEITPFGVDLERFQPAALGRDGALTIGTVKTLAPAYGIDLLLRAFAGLPADGFDRPLRLCIVGGGPQAADLQALAKSLGLEARVHFAGPVPHAEVPRQLQALDVYVAPSRHESFGVAVVEAMACGRPVVVSDAGGLPEVVEHGVSGLVVPVGDVPALTRALAQLAGDAGLRARLGQGARARAEACYGWPRCVDTMLAVHDRIVRDTSAP